MHQARLLLLTLLAGGAPMVLPAQDVAGALLPLPHALRAGAGVVRLDDQKQPLVIRSGTNGMICIADIPADDQFDVRCYHEALIQVVYRAFQHGYRVAGPKVAAEIQAGTLALSRAPTAGYRCLGPARGYDGATGRLDPEVECWQSVHFPFLTAAEIGLPDEAEVPEERRRDTPYVMAGGGYWSHVMIRHPRPR